MGTVKNCEQMQATVLLNLKTFWTFHPFYRVFGVYRVLLRAVAPDLCSSPGCASLYNHRDLRRRLLWGTDLNRFHYFANDLLSRILCSVVPEMFYECSLLATWRYLRLALKQTNISKYSFTVAAVPVRSVSCGRLTESQPRALYVRHRHGTTALCQQPILGAEERS